MEQRRKRAAPTVRPGCHPGRGGAGLGGVTSVGEPLAHRLSMSVPAARGKCGHAPGWIGESAYPVWRMLPVTEPDNEKPGWAAAIEQVTEPRAAPLVACTVCD
jgi:hypothetical protein